MFVGPKQGEMPPPLMTSLMEEENPYRFLFHEILVFCADFSTDPNEPPKKQFCYITLMPLKFIDSVTDNNSKV